jgi:hypothetical protein
MATAFTTAIEAWDKRWSTAEGRTDWLDPDPDVRALLKQQQHRKPGSWHWHIIAERRPQETI